MSKLPSWVKSLQCPIKVIVAEMTIRLVLKKKDTESIIYNFV